VYDLPLASLPTRKPRTPMEVPTPDLDRFNRSGPSLMLLRNRHAITPQFYRLLFPLEFLSVRPAFYLSLLESGVGYFL